MIKHPSVSLWFQRTALAAAILSPMLLSGAKSHAFGLRRTAAIPSAPTAPTPPPIPAATPPPAPTGVAASCQSSDPEFQCIGIKLVSYLDELGNAVISETEGRELVRQMNSVWSSCKIGFQLENYLAVNPSAMGLKFDPYWQTEASDVRAAFSDARTFLVVAVGTLSSSTIAVTQMPYSSPYGTLVEKDFAKNALTVGHELGHYMGLYHYRNVQNLMNPYIGSDTQDLTADQCSTARSTNTEYWPNMLR